MNIKNQRVYILRSKFNTMDIYNFNENLDETNIKSILDKWSEIVTLRKQFDEYEEQIKNKIKVFLKERQWKEYYCKANGVNITISVQNRETIDTNQLKMVLTPSQLATVTRITSFEKMLITNKEMRDNIKKFIKK